MKQLLVFSLAFAILSPSAQAATIASYDADPDNSLATAAPNPSTQGWTSTATDQLSAPDNTGWRLDDVSNTQNPRNEFGLTATDFADMYNNGWTYEVTVRGNVFSGAAGFTGWGIAAGDGTGLWGFTGRERVAFNLTDGGTGTDLTIGDLSSGDNTTIIGGVGRYQTIRIEGAALSENYEVFVNNVSAWSSTISTGGSNSSNDNRVVFASGSTGGVGRQTDWGSVNLTAIPEPSSIALVGLGLIGLAGLRRRS